MVQRIDGIRKKGVDLLYRSRRVRMMYLRTLSWLCAALRVLCPEGWTRVGPPRRVISQYELLKEKAPGVSGRIVLHGQPTTEFGPGTLAAWGGVDESQFQPRPIIVTHNKDARLVTRTLGLAVRPKALVSDCSYPGILWQEPANNYVYLPGETYLKGNYTSVVSFFVKNNFVPNFSHWLLDALPRLAVMDEFPADTVVLVPSKLAGYQRESLEMLGLGQRYRLTPERHLRVENYYFSSPTGWNVRENKYAVDFLRRTFLPKASAGFSGPKRFVIDRPTHARGMINRTEFNAFFEKLGWAIVDTGEMSFADEIKLFSEAEAIAGVIGSGFTNAVWCKPGCAVFQIVPENINEPSTEWICHHNQLRWRYLLSPANRHRQPTVDMTAVKRILGELGLVD